MRSAALPIRPPFAALTAALTLILAAAISLMAGSGWADQPTCASQASDKKLAGAAKASFMKKCQSDAAG